MEAAQMQATMPAAAPKQKIVAFLLGFFLGVFGVHNFYLGKKGMGLTQLLVTVLTLGFGAWSSVHGPRSSRSCLHGQASTTPTATRWSEVDQAILIHHQGWASARSVNGTSEPVLRCFGLRNKVGAQGFEPCPAGFFWIPLLLCERASCGRTRVGAPVGHQPSANPHVVIPVQLEPALLPSYTIPPIVDAKSVLGLSARTLSASQLLLRHFHRWLPVFFHAREPRFMVNVSATCRQYMSASDHVATL